MGKKARGLVFVISAPSGSGKTTLCKRLLSDFAKESRVRSHKVTVAPVLCVSPDCDQRRLVRSVSVTTRAPRRGEIEGKDYFFISSKIFELKKSSGEFLEWAEVFSNYYGTPRKFVEETIAKGDDVLLSIDVQGAMQVKKHYPDCISIFILPPSINTLKDRLSRRSTEGKAEVSKRLEVAHKELSYIDKYNYRVINDRIEKALFGLRSIIVAERCRMRKI